MIKIHIADSVWTITNQAGAKALNNLLSFPKEFWAADANGKKKRTRYTEYLISKGARKDEYLFLTGLIPRVLDFLDQKKLWYEFTTDVVPVEFDEPKVEGIVFRDYQQNIIESALEEGRGVIKAATASGKSICILGIISAFTQENILLLVHTSDLVKQLVDDLEKFGFNPSIFSGKNKEIGRITVATIQSYKKICLDYVDHWHVVLIDESLKGDMRITTDKGQIPIKGIVLNEMDVKVLSWNEELETPEWKKILKYHIHTPKSPMLEIKHEHGTLKVTENHKVFVKNQGWILAKSLKEGDILLFQAEGKINYETLIKLLDYNPKTGIFTWKETRGAVKAGDIAGGSDKDGYVIICKEKAHRLAWFYIYKKWPNGNLDHIDQIPYHNWISNLREATKSENAINCGTPKQDSSAKLRGIHWYKSRKQWQVYIINNQKQISIGYFNEFDNAVRARLKAEQNLGWHKINKNTPAFDYIERLEGRRIKNKKWRRLRNENKRKQSSKC